MKGDASTNNSVIADVSSYISNGVNMELPPEVIKKAKHHILDTLAAMVSGSRLKPGELAKKYVKSQQGAGEAQVAGSQIVTSAINAAFANSVMIHARDFDDTHDSAVVHANVVTLPTVMALSEKIGGIKGGELLTGLVLGVDISCRLRLAIGNAPGFSQRERG